MGRKQSRKHWDIVVVGAGAAGLMAAVSASLHSREKLTIAVLERNDRAGRKLLATGNGRCNYTNVNCSAQDLGVFTQPALTAFSPGAVLEFFEGLGVYPRIEEEGRVYPYSGQGAAVLTGLLEKAQSSGVEFLYQKAVKTVTIESSGFALQTETGELFSAARVILATAGKAGIQYGSLGQGYKIAESLGHQIVKPVPALTALSCEGNRGTSLKGVRAKGRVTLRKNGQELAADEGEIQFTEDGLSGICVFNISRHVRYEKGETVDFTAAVDLLPELSGEAVEQLLQRRRGNLPTRPAREFLSGLLHQKLSWTIMGELTADAGALQSTSRLTDAQLHRLAVRLKDWRFPVSGTKSWKEAQVTSGGVATEFVNPVTMESALAPNLYFAGELLDVDGRCGGYNLQWAWSSGYVAGKAAAEQTR